MDMNQQAQAEYRAYCDYHDRRRTVMIDKTAALVLAFVGTFLIVACLL